MKMTRVRLRCRSPIAQNLRLLKRWSKPVLSLTISVFLGTATVSPQSPAGPAPSASTAVQAKISEPSGPRPDKNRAQNAYQTGRRAEQEADWQEAYAAYSDATAYAPGNKEYPLLREHARFQLIQGLADLAERQLLAGDTAGAREQLVRALEIDPNYAIAQERLAELPSDASAPAPDQGLKLAGLPRLKPKPGTRDFDYLGTTRSAYEELGREYGVTVSFDGDLADRPIRFRAPKVDFETALLVLSRQTRTFTRVVDDHTLFVTEDNAQKQREYALEVERSLVLPASVSSDEMNETVRMIREMTGITRTQLNTAARTLTVRSTEQNVALAQALLEEIEQPHGEMMLEIEILQVDRDAAHKLGIVPPSSSTVFTLTPAQIFQLQQAQKNGNLLSVIQGIFGSNSALASAAGTLGSVLPPLIAFGGGRTIFLATVPGASANFSQTLSAVRSARRVLLRAQDGKPATFFVGDRFPISLAVLSNSLATTTTSSLAAALLLGSLPHASYATGQSPVALATGNFFTGDSHLDLAVANQGDSQNSGTVSILRGVGDGTFGAHNDFAVHTAQDTKLSVPSDIAVGDFNGDGFLDLAVTDSANNNVAILLGKGDGTFTPPVTFPTGLGTTATGNPVALLAADLNGDGVLDLAVVNQGDGVTAGSVSILLGHVVNSRGDGTFAAPTIHSVGVKPTAIASADLNADGLTDLVVTNQNDNSVSVLLQNSDHTFTAKLDPATGKNPATGNGPAGITVADFNRDGHLDLAVTNQTDNTVSILLGNGASGGNGDGTFKTHTDFATGAGPKGIVAADFANSGNLDLAVADQPGNKVSVLIGNGDGTFASPVSLTSGSGPVALTTADLTGNGSLDLIDADQNANTVTVTLNTLQSSGSSSPLSSNSSAGQSAYPSAEYVDLGIKVKATPRLHGDDEVTLHLEFDIRSLSGAAVNGIPVLTNRTLDQTVRLRENQTSVLSGIVETNEARTISGYPETSTIPGAGYLTGNRSVDVKDSEMLFVITPRALRLPRRNPRAIYAGRGEPSTPPTPVGPPPGLNAPPPPPPAQQPAPAPGTQPEPPQQPPSPAPAPPGGIQLPPFGRQQQQNPSP
jgi:type II secretory pathway component GspD/PulD (secretin)